MRYFFLLASWFLLHIVTGIDLARDELTLKNERDCGKIKELPVRKKRESHVRARRGQRQVGFFETSGENISDNEFVTQDVRGPGIRGDDKSENSLGYGLNPYDQGRQNGLQKNVNMRTEGANGNPKFQPKFQLFHVNDDVVDSDDLPYRKQRQVKRYEPTSEVLRGPDKPEVNKNFINLLRWNKNKETVSDLFPPGVQRNEAYPINDDVADFAVYMNKTNKRKSKSKSSSTSNSWDRRYADLTSDNQPASDFSDDVNLHPPDWQVNSAGDSVSHEDNYSENSPKIKKETVNTLEEFLFPSDDLNWDKTKSNSQKRTIDHFASADSLIKSALVNENEAESHSLDSAEDSQEDSSNIVGDVVREKTIILPEPLVFNSSHVVASFVYTMIPFRSPLLNLLENDKHSKYIMIKIDPVLQPSKRISLSDMQLKSDNIEYTLEKNVMRVINKLIGSDCQWDLTTVLEGQPRSKQKYKTMNSRYYRDSDDEPTSGNQASSPHNLNCFNGVIS